MGVRKKGEIKAYYIEISPFSFPSSLELQFLFCIYDRISLGFGSDFLFFLFPYAVFLTIVLHRFIVHLNFTIISITCTLTPPIMAYEKRNELNNLDIHTDHTNTTDKLDHTVCTNHISASIYTHGWRERVHQQLLNATKP